MHFRINHLPLFWVFHFFLFRREKCRNVFHREGLYPLSLTTGPEATQAATRAATRHRRPTASLTWGQLPAGGQGDDGAADLRLAGDRAWHYTNLHDAGYTRDITARPMSTGNLVGDEQLRRWRTVDTAPAIYGERRDTSVSGVFTGSHCNIPKFQKFKNYMHTYSS